MESKVYGFTTLACTLIGMTCVCVCVFLQYVQYGQQSMEPPASTVALLMAQSQQVCLMSIYQYSFREKQTFSVS